MSEINKVARYMQDNHLVLVTAESCTAGLIAGRLADFPGAGEILDCAFVTYSPTSKQRSLGVKGATIETYGLTSEEVAAEMAQGALARSNANVAIANTGVTEPMPGGPPEGTQCYAWVFKHSDAAVKTFTETRQFHGERNQIRETSTDFALLELVRLHMRL